MVARLALLICDTPIPPILEAHGDYHAIYTKFLKDSLPDPSVGFTLDPYDVVHEHYPHPERYDGIIITGSSASAYGTLPWISKLVEYVSNVINQFPKVKIIGICFGQQIVSLACKGACESNNGIWEVGVFQMDLMPLGQHIFQSHSVRIQQMHRDHVPAVPPNFHLLGSTPACLVHGMVLLYPNASSVSKPSLKDDVHVLAVQGHPEFNADIVQKLVNVRGKAGIMNEETVKDAQKRAVLEHDGVSIIGKTIWRVFGLVIVENAERCFNNAALVNVVCGHWCS